MALLTCSEIYFRNVAQKLKIDLAGNCCAFHTIKLNSISFPCLPFMRAAANSPPLQFSSSSLFCHIQLLNKHWAGGGCRTKNPTLALLLLLLARAVQLQCTRAVDDVLASTSYLYSSSCCLSSATINSSGNKLHCKCLINCTYLFGSPVGRSVDHTGRVSFIFETYLQAVLGAPPSPPVTTRLDKSEAQWSHCCS